MTILRGKVESAVNAEKYMAVKKVKFKIIRNPELVAAGQAFVPVFGHDGDRSLVSRIIAFEVLLGTVDNQVLRDGKFLTKKMQDILFMERNLIGALTSRNNDF